MLSALLMILKIIGIVLLVVVMVVLILLLLILFVPVRYRISGCRKSGDTDPVHVRVNISWLLHMIGIVVSYPEPVYLRVKVFFLTIFSLSEEKKKKREEKQKRKEEKQKRKEEKQKEKEERRRRKKGSDPDADSDTEQETEKDAHENDAHEKNSDHEIDKDIDFETNQKADQKIGRNNEGPADGKEAWESGSESHIPFWKKPFLKIVKIIKNIRYTFLKIYAKIKDTAFHIREYIDILKSNEFRAAFSLCSGQLLKIYRNIKPKRLQAHLTIGMSDPGTTGQILEVYSILYPIIGNNVFVTPDFEQAVIEGDFYIKGRVSAYVILLAAWKIYRDKNIRKLIRLLKREEV